MDAIGQYEGPIMFLAGGISGCENWQKTVCKELADDPFECVVINPRREGDLAKDSAEAIRQIEWEYAGLFWADLISFWFPKETLCPITLLEYGMALKNMRAKIVLGIHPEYQRRFDLEQQTKLYRPTIRPVFSIDAMVAQIKDAVRNI